LLRTALAWFHVQGTMFMVMTSVEFYSISSRFRVGSSRDSSPYHWTEVRSRPNIVNEDRTDRSNLGPNLYAKRESSPVKLRIGVRPSDWVCDRIGRFRHVKSQNFGRIHAWHTSQVKDGPQCALDLWMSMSQTLASRRSS
jgi:hypothetical protein